MSQHLPTALIAAGAQDLCARYFPLSQATLDAPQTVADLAWLLFLVAKASLLHRSPDLVSAYNLLVCVVSCLLQCLPQQTREAEAAASGPPGSCLSVLATANKASAGSAQVSKPEHFSWPASICGTPVVFHRCLCQPALVDSRACLPQSVHGTARWWYVSLQVAMQTHSQGS